MACFHPVTAYKCYSADYDLHPFVSHNLHVAEHSARFESFKHPCGQCIGCRLDYSRDWAVRCMHELKFSADAWFITLTYRDEFLLADGSLKPDDLCNFWKRFRKRCCSKIRYFACGEYGDRLQRPHFHSIVFGDSLPEKCLVGRLRSGYPFFRCRELEECWPFGFVTIAPVSLNTCAYVARYVTKKLTGHSNNFVSDVFDDDGVVIGYDVEDFRRYPDGRIKPFSRCSRRPGLGTRFLEKFWSDIYPLDKVVFFENGKSKTFSVPRFYDKWMSKFHPDVLQSVKEVRLLRGLELSINDDFSLSSMARKEECMLIKLEHAMSRYGNSFNRCDL